MKTIIVGLGNPILGDDGIGWQIASEIQKNQILPPDVTIECMSIGGISLMEALIGYDNAIIIDAITTHLAPIGTVNSSSLSELVNPSLGHMTSAHDMSLQDALKMGRSLGAHLPNRISVVTVEAEKIYEFSETLSDPVARAIPQAVTTIMHLLIESRPSNSINV